jgi:hypothetical protein
MNFSQEQILRAAFIAGAVTDALALVPMLFPSMAGLLWGFEDITGPYRFAMGYAASLMAAWTALLLWAAMRPIERSFVAALTVFIIYGLIVTEILAVLGGYISVSRMMPTWCLQAVLLGLFAGGYHYGWLRRWVLAS